MSDVEKNGRKFPINLNTLLMVIVIAVMGWVGTTLLQLSKDVTQLQAITASQSAKLDRIEVDLTRHREVIAELQRDIAVIKVRR